MDRLIDFWRGFTCGAVVYVIAFYIVERYWDELRDMTITWLKRLWYD